MVWYFKFSLNLFFQVDQKGFMMSLAVNIHLAIALYIFYFCIKRTIWTNAFKLVLKDSRRPRLERQNYSSTDSS